MRAVAPARHPARNRVLLPVVVLPAILPQTVVLSAVLPRAVILQAVILPTIVPLVVISQAVILPTIVPLVVISQAVILPTIALLVVFLLVVFSLVVFLESIALQQTCTLLRAVGRASTCHGCETIPPEAVSPADQRIRAIRTFGTNRSESGGEGASTETVADQPDRQRRPEPHGPQPRRRTAETALRAATSTGSHTGEKGGA